VSDGNSTSSGCLEIRNIVSHIDTTNHVPVPERRLVKIVKDRFQIVCGPNPWKEVCSSLGRFDENSIRRKPIKRQGMKL